MAEWLYKATKSKAGPGTTRHLAKEHGFLCRSLHTKSGGKASNVQAVGFGDVIHIYYVFSDKNPERIGRFTVIEQQEHPKAELFGEHVPGTALALVKDAAFISKSDPHGAYAVDPELQVFTGWLLRYEGEAMPPPLKFQKDMATLVRVEEKSSSGNQVA